LADFVIFNECPYTVQDIAEMVGYNDLATFRKHFVDFYGTTPSTFCNKMLMEKSE